MSLNSDRPQVVDDSVHDLLKLQGNDGTRVEHKCVMTTPKGSKHLFTVRCRYDATGIAAISIFVGGSLKSDCLDFLIYTNSQVGILNDVRHHLGCQLNGDLERGTSREMLSTSLWCIHELCPWITSVRLNDKSSVPCGDNLSVSLPSLHILRKGKTWYEDAFGAQLDPPSTHTKYRKRIEALADPSEKTALPWEMFEEQYRPPTQLKLLYEESGTFAEFFDRIKEQAVVIIPSVNPDIALCSCVMPWLERFMANTNPFLNSPISFPWFIRMPPMHPPIPKHAGMSLTLYEHQTGGGGRSSVQRSKEAYKEWVSQWDVSRKRLSGL